MTTIANHASSVTEVRSGSPEGSVAYSGAVVAIVNRALLRSPSIALRFIEGTTINLKFPSFPRRRESNFVEISRPYENLDSRLRA